MPSVMDRILSQFTPEYQALKAEVTELKRRMNMAVTQEQVDALKSEFAASFAEIEKDIEALMASQPVGAPMSQETFDAFKALAARAKAAGEVFTAPVAEPPVV